MQSKTTKAMELLFYIPNLFSLVLNINLGNDIFNNDAIGLFIKDQSNGIIKNNHVTFY